MKSLWKKKYTSEIVNPRRRGKPVVKWKDRVKENMHERVADREGEIKLERRAYLDDER